jgi:protein-S-isoprenylcysteine O-methyltransferase Ste14
LFGVAAHALLVATVWYLFPFLQGGATAPGGPDWQSGLLPSFRNAAPTLAVDSLLALQFAVLHSLLLLRPVRDRLEDLIPRQLYGCVFALTTCISLLVTMLAWQPIPLAIWRLEGMAGSAVSAGYLLGWGALVYTLSLTGFGYQTGWTPYWAWLRRREPPRRRFEPRGAYRLLRHPVYLSLLTLIWLTPVLTLDRLLLGVWWTAYVFVGSYLKDRRLEFYLGDAYRVYEAEVPGYALIGMGPLGRRARTPATGSKAAFTPSPQPG